MVDDDGRRRQPITRDQVETLVRAAAGGADVTLLSPRIGVVSYTRAAGYDIEDSRAVEYRDDVTIEMTTAVRGCRAEARALRWCGSRCDGRD
jgi:hypothetical protein